MKRILILDDETSIVFGLSRCLQSDKVDVIHCPDSQSAKGAVSRFGVDAIISDVRISAADSHESIDFIHYVRSRDRHLPLIVMSGTEDLKSEAMEEGADYFFQKPIDLDELIRLLRNMGLEVGRNVEECC